MEYFLGIDGGGTKTECLLADGTGRLLARQLGVGSSYKQHGAQAVAQRLAQAALTCATQAGIEVSQLTGVCIGLPLYGENRAMDEEMRRLLAAAFDGVPLAVYNDVNVGWAGSLACRPGINLVAGTGSIAYGEDAQGNGMRCGGWSEHFSDEGSCYWASLRAMELFTKQADGRLAKGPFYSLVRQKLDIEEDFDFIGLMERDWLPYRDKAASFQIILCDAALQGDEAAIQIFEAAAQELYLMARAVRDGLGFTGRGTAVSYSGGMFKAGALVLKPFEALLEKQGMVLAAPIASPAWGAVLLAARTFSPAAFKGVGRAIEEKGLRPG